MLGSSVSLRGPHAGLLKLSALAELSRSSLGPWKSFKFLHDDTTGESALVSSSYRILENLELSCPVAQLVLETLQAHQKVHHTGSGCLLFLTGAWSRAALHCLQEGIPASHVMSAMNEGLDLCRDVFRRSSVSLETISACCPAASQGSGLRLPEKLPIEKLPIEKLLTEKLPIEKLPTEKLPIEKLPIEKLLQDGSKTLNFSGQRKVKLSRHFSEINSGNVSKVSKLPEPKLPEPKLPEPKLPEPKLPEPKLPEPKLPEQKLPEPKLPEPKLPEQKLPEQKLPEPKLPEQKLPEQKLPEPKLPEPKLPEQKLPEPKFPEPKLPEQKLPEQKLPEQKLPEPKLPEPKLPEPKLPEQKLPEQKLLEPKLPEPKLPALAAVALGLSHGCDESMRLVMEAIQVQSEAAQEDGGRPPLDVTGVLTCLVPGVSEHQACVVRGCVVLLSAEQALLAQRLRGRSLQVALITGDLSEDFRHLGFHRLTGTRRVSERLPGSSGEDGWTETVGAVLLSLDVNLVLVSGSACQSMAEFCWRHQILVVEKVKGSTLRMFADATGAVAVAYAAQLSRQSVGSGATLSIWRDLSGRHGTPAAAVNICPGGGGPVTVILTSYLPGKLPALEDRFWACAHRLHCALEDGVLLPGAGGTELLCVRRLLRRDAPGRLRALVFPLMAEGLTEYLSTVMVNTGTVSRLQARTLLSQQLLDEQPGRLLLEAGRQEVMEPEEPEVYDNLSVKQDAWRAALDVVFLVLQSDAEILTGGGPHPRPSEGRLGRLGAPSGPDSGTQRL